MDILVSIEGREELHLRWDESGALAPTVKAVGGLKFLSRVDEWRPKLQGPPGAWPLPEGTSVADLLLREMILKAQGQWKPPYQEPELCHCRAIPLKSVEDAIRAGAHKATVVSRWTSASTACGTCRPDVEALLAYFLAA
jgi:bacterioferritin-associated ferredoxin